MIFEKTKAFIGSRRFLIFIFVWFVFQAGWMSFSNRYNAPHDEASHVSSISEYSANGFSPILRLENLEDGSHYKSTYSTSYFYYYTMSVPYKVVTSLSGSKFIMLAVMRFINLVISFVGLYVLVKLLKRLMPRQPVMTNFVAFTYVCTTVYTYIAGGVSYDNMQLLMLFASFYFFIDYFKAQRLQTIMWFILFSSLAVVTKFTSLLIVVPLFAYLLYRIVRDWGEFNKLFKRFFIYKDKIRVKNLTAFIFFILVILAVLHRPINNIVKYGTPEPRCRQVYSLDVCLRDGLFERNYKLRNINKDTDRINLYTYYFGLWINNMRNTTFGIYNSTQARDDTALIRGASWLLIFVTPLLIYSQRKKLAQDRTRAALISVAGIYCLILVLKNYSTYLELGAPLALQGRYILPVLPFLYLASAIILDGVFTKKWAKGVLLTLGLFVLLTSGLTSYILLSDDDWYFENNAVEVANDAAKNIVRPLEVIVLDKSE